MTIKFNCLRVYWIFVKVWSLKSNYNKEYGRLIKEFFPKICTHIGFPIGDNLPYNKNYCAVHWHRTWQFFSCVLAGSQLIRVYYETSNCLKALWLRCTRLLRTNFSKKQLLFSGNVVLFRFRNIHRRTSLIRKLLLEKQLNWRVVVLSWSWLSAGSFFGFLKLLTDKLCSLDALDDDCEITCWKI